MKATTLPKYAKSEIHRIRYKVVQNFMNLEIANLITNTIKHGDGLAKRKLETLRPDLFREIRSKKVLRVDLSHFDTTAATIDKIWSEYEKAFGNR